MSLNDYALRSLAGDYEAPIGFIEHLPDDVRAGFGPRIARVQTIAYDALLRDTAAFLAFKTPDPLPVLGLAEFREVLDLAIVGDFEAVRVRFSSLGLPQLYVYYSLSARLHQAWTARPMLRGAPLTAGAPALVQSEMF